LSSYTASNIVSIVGRPNVGKSTLINRIISRREAIVESQAGVTRDRKYYAADWNGIEFLLVDTGGLQTYPSDQLSWSISQQALLAAKESDVIIFLVDATEGLTPADQEASHELRRLGKPVLLVVNKVDNRKRETEALPEFYELGWSDPLPISALHGIGIGELLDRVVELLPPKEVSKEGEKRIERITVAILGRPNVGKSSLFNRLIGEERSIICEAPGTTRDAVDTEVEAAGRRYLFVDTAGWRRRSRLQDQVEYYSLVRVWEALDRADVALLIIDAREGVTDQDQKIAARIRDDGVASIMILNKWDLVRGGERAREVEREVGEKLHFISYSLLLKTSALTGYGVGKIIPAIDQTYQNWSARIQTAELNRLREEILLKTSPPSRGGKHLHIYYLVQARTSPPEFVFFVNDPSLVTPAYARFLERRIRELFDFSGSPIRIVIRGKRK
jgi:GTP-binding protein